MLETSLRAQPVNGPARGVSTVSRPLRWISATSLTTGPQPALSLLLVTFRSAVNRSRGNRSRLPDVSNDGAFFSDADVPRSDRCRDFRASRALRGISWLRIYFYAFPLTSDDVAALSTGVIAALERKGKQAAVGGRDMSHSRAVLHFLLDSDSHLSNVSRGARSDLHDCRGARDCQECHSDLPVRRQAGAGQDQGRVGLRSGIDQRREARDELTLTNFPCSPGIDQVSQSHLKWESIGDRRGIAASMGRLLVAQSEGPRAARGARVTEIGKRRRGPAASIGFDSRMSRMAQKPSLFMTPALTELNRRDSDDADGSAFSPSLRRGGVPRPGWTSPRSPFTSAF